MAAKLKTVLPSLPSFDELDGGRPDPDQLLASAEEAAGALYKKDDPDYSRHAMLAFQQQLILWQSSGNRESILWARGQQTASMEEDRLFFNRHAEVPYQAEKIFYEALLKSPYERMVHEDADRDLWARAHSWKLFEANVPVELFRREEELKQHLLKLRPSFYDLADEVSAGKELLVRGNRELRSEMLRGLSEELQAQSSERCKTFLELFAVRREIARICSCKNYAEYCSERSAIKSFNRQEKQLFVNAFRKQFRPVIKEIIRQRDRRFGAEQNSLIDYPLLAPQGEPILQLSQRDTIHIFRGIIRKLLGEEENILSELIDKGYVNFSPGIAEKIGKSAVLLPSLPAAFLNLPLQNELSPAIQLFLHSGEALADISAMLNYHILGSSRQDDLTRKISSLFFLRLTGRELSSVYGAAATLAQDLCWLRILMRLPLHMALFEMEDRIYSASDAKDLGTFQEEWTALRERWMPDLRIPNDGYFSANLGWMYFLSGREEAFSDLNLPMALVAVLSTKQAGRDTRGLSSVFNAMLLTNPGSPLRERLHLSGVGNPLQEDKLQKAAFMVCDLLEL